MSPGRTTGALGRAAWLLLACALGLACSLPARAGRACETHPPQVVDIERGMALAQRTAQALDASGAEVVILARAGQDLRRWGLNWSHVGFVYRDRRDPAHPVWRVVHKLNQCGTDQAQVYRQGLGEFFLDQPFRYEAAFVAMQPAVAQRLLPLLADNQRLGRWHSVRYSMLAYPWSQRYQQSNQWVIETLAGAMDDAAFDRGHAQAWLQLRGYQAGTLHIDALTRLGARISRANIAFDDHPNAQRFADRIDTVTADSVLGWLAQADLSGPLQTLR
jgi:hypothetical protein